MNGCIDGRKGGGRGRERERGKEGRQDRWMDRWMDAIKSKILDKQSGELVYLCKVNQIGRNGSGLTLLVKKTPFA